MVNENYPGGRESKAALIPVVLIRNEGKPVTKLFHEYGSAIKTPDGTDGDANSFTDFSSYSTGNLSHHVKIGKSKSQMSYGLL